eukprot:103343-Prorocentrum_minimum.AAC.1
MVSRHPNPRPPLNWRHALNSGTPREPGFPERPPFTGGPCSSPSPENTRQILLYAFGYKAASIYLYVVLDHVMFSSRAITGNHTGLSQCLLTYLRLAFKSWQSSFSSAEAGVCES